MDRTVSEEYIEGVVCKESEIVENEMKICEIGPDKDKLLLIKQHGVINAIGSKCSHYGALLSTGALGNGRVRCPWHGACFNIKTGDIEDYPGLDSIPCYQVEILSDGGVKVRAKKSDLKKNKVTKDMCIRDANNSTTFVIVGGGAAGQICAETLRQEGFTGRIIVITADQYPPYDRIKISKQLNFTLEQLQLRPNEFYKEHGIELKLARKAVALDAKQKILTLDNGEQLKYTSIFLATGSTPRKLELPGSDFKNVFTLRTLSDSHAIHNAVKPNSNVVVFGSSFIGMEVAAACIKICGTEGSVTVIGRSAVPFAESFGEVVGRRIAHIFTEKNVKMLGGVTIKEIQGTNSEPKSILLSNGETIPGDVIVFGLGGIFSTDFVRDSGINLNDNGSVPVNKFLETNCPGAFAGGDIADAPVYVAGDINKTIGHWGLAHYHGKIAALNMMSITTPLKAVPFFWTMLFGLSFRYAGYATSYDDTLISGDVEGLKFACYYLKDKVVTAITTIGLDPLAAQYAEYIYNGNKLNRNDIEKEPLTWPQSKLQLAK